MSRPYQISLFALIALGLGSGGYYYTAMLDNSLPFIGNPFADPASADPIAAAGGGSGEESPTTVADSTQQAAADSGSPGLAADSTALADSTTQDSVEVAEPEPDPPAPRAGRLVLSGVPDGAVIMLDGRPQQDTNIVLMPGTFRLVVRHDDYENFHLRLTIRDGQRRDVPVEMTLISQCEDLNASYNADGSCYDAMPRPLDPTLVPLTATVQGRPTPATLGIQVNADGSVAQVRIVTRSNNDAFTAAAIQFANTIRYNAAQKDGQTVTAWTQLVFFPGPRTLPVR